METVGKITQPLNEVKGSRKNKFAISGVEAPGRQDSKKHEYQAYS